MSILLVSTLQTKLDRLQAKIKHKGIVLELVFRKTGVRLNPQNPWSHYHLAKCFLKAKTMARCRGGLPKNLRTQS